MRVCDIDFAPLNVPFRRRMQTLAVAAYVTIMIGGGIMGLSLAAYFVLCTSFLRWPTLLYLAWIWTIDRNVCDKGGRRFTWVRNWTWWTYLKDYFPISLKKVAGVDLDPAKNYLFCCFPHGIVSTGLFSAFNTNISGVNVLFPHHTVHFLTLKQNFYFPFYRDLGLALGGCSASATSISHLLSGPKGGNVAALVVGGAAEAFHSRPDRYKIVLAKRKGFVKLAIRNGAPLVPVISFGETDLYDQVKNPEGSFVRKFQELIKKVTGVAPVFLIGRGFFQYTYGFLPRRKAITTLVGRPIDVVKSSHPTQEEIDALHAKFTEDLVELFEVHKRFYIKNSDQIKLEIVE